MYHMLFYMTAKAISIKLSSLRIENKSTITIKRASLSRASISCHQSEPQVLDGTADLAMTAHLGAATVATKPTDAKKQLKRSSLLGDCGICCQLCPEDCLESKQLVVLQSRLSIQIFH